MNTKVKNISLIIAIAASVSSFNASAADRKAYNGSMCQPLHGSQAHMFYSSATTGISNEPFNGTASSKGGWVNCPIVRDTTDNTNGVKIWVNVYRDGITSSPLRCTVYSNNSTATSTVASQTRAIALKST